MSASDATVNHSVGITAQEELQLRPTSASGAGKSCVRVDEARRRRSVPGSSPRSVCFPEEGRVWRRQGPAVQTKNALLLHNAGLEREIRKQAARGESGNLINAGHLFPFPRKWRIALARNRPHFM